uniref:Uncharacterized protein n=1 Tax=Glossina palpalis gambiensis TaxID=67801 RepID=A0A1B0B5C5_9MUSC
MGARLDTQINGSDDESLNNEHDIALVINIPERSRYQIETRDNKYEALTTGEPGHCKCVTINKKRARRVAIAALNFVSFAILTGMIPSNIIGYVHFYNRNSNHIRCLNYVNKLYLTIKEHLEGIREKDLSYNEESCKCTMSVPPDSGVHLCCLCDYLERRVVSERLPNIKIDVLNKYCERRCDVLLRHLHEGYETDSCGYAESGSTVKRIIFIFAFLICISVLK